MENLELVKKQIKRNHLFYIMHGKKRLIQKLYQEHTRKNLNLNSASTFREKLHLRKMSTEPLLSKCADKNAVRDYVEKKIGKQYLIPIYFCKKHIRPQDLYDLPNSFVLKTTSGSGTNIIVHDKTKTDITKICKQMNDYTKIKYGYLWGELYYNKINNKIIAEKLLTKDTVYDYKIHCFRDEKNKLRQIIEVMWGPKTNRHKKMYDDKWQPLTYYFSLPPSPQSFKKPKQLQTLLELSDKLSKDFSYVRTDFYIINNKIYFGELTFVPTAGFNDFNPPKYDKIWGEWISKSIILKQ